MAVNTMMDESAMIPLPCIFATPASPKDIADARLPPGIWRTCNRPAFGKRGAFVSPCRTDSRTCGPECQGYVIDPAGHGVPCVEFGPTPPKVDRLTATLQTMLGPNVTVNGNATGQKRPQCVNLTMTPTGNLVSCPTCSGNVQLKLFPCSVHGQCTIGTRAPGVACCDDQCGEYAPSSRMDRDRE